jgi:hypothetical protein
MEEEKRREVMDRVVISDLVTALTVLVIIVFLWSH